MDNQYTSLTRSHISDFHKFLDQTLLELAALSTCPRSSNEGVKDFARPPLSCETSFAILFCLALLDESNWKFSNDCFSSLFFGSDSLLLGTNIRNN
uniref:Uncharacterized protein n=1 Tax=Octopus bimaculoides TaxID=37653 RepID=A0A0L8FJA6_OCTBM